MQKTIKLKFRNGYEVIVPDNDFNRQFYKKHYNGQYSIENIDEQKKEKEHKPEIVESVTNTVENVDNTVENVHEDKPVRPQRGRPATHKDEN